MYMKKFPASPWQKVGEWMEFPFLKKCTTVQAFNRMGKIFFRFLKEIK